MAFFSKQFLKYYRISSWTPNYTFVNFNVSTFMAPYLHQFSSVMQKINFFGANLALWYKVLPELTLWRCYFNLTMQHQHQSIKKALYLMPNLYFFLVQMMCADIMHFLVGQRILHLWINYLSKLMIIRTNILSLLWLFGDFSLQNMD